MTGTVYLVGAGPGAADLLTLRAARLLAQAEVVFHDSLIPPETLALARSARLVPVGKRCGQHSTAQHFINKQLADAARRHELVVRLKGGDPMLFGRAHEEISYLKAQGIRVEVVPGITAALGASAALGISLTRRGAARTVSFVTPRVAPGKPESRWIDSVLAADTAAIYMGAGEARAISAALIAAGKDPHTPLALVEDASLPGMTVQYATLRELPALATRGGPTLILLGEVIREAGIRGQGRNYSLRAEADRSITTLTPNSPIFESTRLSDASPPAPARWVSSRARARRG